MMRMIGYVLLWAVVMGLLVATVLGLQQARVWLTSPVVAATADPLTVEIPPGTDARQIGRLIERAGGHVTPTAFYWTVRLRGMARSLRAGEYRIAPGETLGGLEQRLQKGDVVMHQLTIPEGVTARVFLTRLAEDPAIDHTLKGLNAQQIIHTLNLPVDHLEGWLFPDTYLFPRGTTDREILFKAYHAMKRRLDAAWADRASGLPLNTPYQALILASIIEKETGVPAERAHVASVFINRLERGMRLQTDPTVIYGLGKEYDGSLTESDLRHDTPYNTYTRRGLPPTPIALPSEASLQAATHPLDTNDLYFVANGKGGHTFSRTLKAHNRAVQAFRRQEQSHADN